jgi:hypothetical protein
MNPKYSILDNQLKSHELNDSRINSRLSLRKKNYNKIFNNKRMLVSELETLFPQESVYNYDLLKILPNIQILKIIQNMNHQSLLDNRTELFQCLFSIDFNMNQNSNDTVVFINEKKIYIFLIDLLEQAVNINNKNNTSQLIFKILQILFKYSSKKENNKNLSNCINNKIYIFNNLFSYIHNNQTIIKKTDILLYSIIILYNLSLESPFLLNIIKKNKIQEQVLSIINDKKINLNINDRNIYFVINFLSLELLEKNVINLEENYIQNIFNLLNNKGITSSSAKVQDLSIYCLCNITSLYESENFYKKIVYSGIFNNIYQYIKKSENINSIIVSLKIVNNILTEKNVDLNTFIKSDLLSGLMQLIINYEHNKANISGDLLYHVINIFRYLVKSPLFYSIIDNNRKFMINIIYLIGKISNNVTLEILSFIKNVINESFTISQLLILNNTELMSNLISIVRDTYNNDKIRTMALVILGKIIDYNNENIDNENLERSKIKALEIQLKELIELNLLNHSNINETLKKAFKEILNMINEE